MADQLDHRKLPLLERVGEAIAVKLQPKSSNSSNSNSSRRNHSRDDHSATRTSDHSTMLKRDTSRKAQPSPRANSAHTALQRDNTKTKNEASTNLRRDNHSRRIPPDSRRDYTKNASSNATFNVTRYCPSTSNDPKQFGRDNGPKSTAEQHHQVEDGRHNYMAKDVDPSDHYHGKSGRRRLNSVPNLDPWGNGWKGERSGVPPELARWMGGSSRQGLPLAGNPNRRERKDYDGIRVPPCDLSTLSPFSQNEMAGCQQDIDSLPPKKHQEQDQWVSRELALHGGCPNRFSWIRFPESKGYRCGGSAHAVFDDSLINQRNEIWIRIDESDRHSRGSHKQKRYVGGLPFGGPEAAGSIYDAVRLTPNGPILPGLRDQNDLNRMLGGRGFKPMGGPSAPRNEHTGEPI